MLVGTRPGSVQTDFCRQATSETAYFADVLEKVNPRLAGLGLRDVCWDSLRFTRP